MFLLQRSDMTTTVCPADNPRDDASFRLIQRMIGDMKHILPKGFTKSRCFGGWSNCCKGEYIQRCAMLLEDRMLPLSPKALKFDTSDFEPSLTTEPDCKNPLCPKCGTEMSQTSASLKPSWYDIMNSSHRPNWYSHIPPRL